MRGFIICLLYSIFSTVMYSQFYGGIRIGTTYPLTTYESVRKFGGEIGIVYGRNVYQQFYFETGLVLDVYGKKNNPIIWTIGTSNNSNIYDGSYMRFSAQIPLLLNYKLLENTLEFNGGFLLSGRYLKTITSYSGLDPEVNGSDDRMYPRFRQYGLDLNLGVCYRLIKELRIYINYRTPINKFFVEDGVFSTGLKYNIISR